MATENLKSSCAYIRVSTDKQEELSPDAQKRLVLDYAKNNGYILSSDNIFIENGISGKKADKRPQFMKMIALAKSKEHPFDVILVWKYSRFARNQEESIVYKSLLKRNNVDVISISEPLVDGPFGSLIERIIEWMDEYYSIRLSGEVMRGMSENAMRGGYQSNLPMGYVMNKNTGIPEIEESGSYIVKKIYNDYSANGKSFLQIARELNALGYRTQRGATFEQRTVRYILENPFYTGKVRWNRQDHVNHVIKDKSEWIIADGKHVPLISNELFDLVQNQILQRCRPYKARGTGNIKHWLSGIVKCSSCGTSLMSTSPSMGRITNYQCGKYLKGACSDSHYIKTEALEQAIYSAFEYAINSGQINFEVKHTTINEDTEDLIRRLHSLDQKEKRIKQAYMNGIDTLEEYSENKAILQKERECLNELLDKSNDLESDHNEMLDQIISTYKIIRDESKDKLERANAIRSVVRKAVYDKENDSLSIYFRLVK